MGKSSSQALSAQVDLLHKRLEEARVAGVSTAELYWAARAIFGSSTLPLSANASAYGILA